MNKVLIIGTDINAYYMSRCYHELTHQKTDVLGKEPMRFTYDSKIMNITIDEDLREEANFKDILINYYQNHYQKSDKVLLVPCHDIYVRLVSENESELSKYYYFNIPNREIVENLLVKEKFYQAYQNIGLPFPKTYFYDVHNELAIPSEYRYPLIIKPSDGIIYNRHHFPGQAKVYKLNTLEEVETIVNKIKESGYTEKIIIQECIMGDDSTLFDSVFYVNTKGEAELATLAQIGLQEHGPTAIGNCTVLINNYNQYGNTEEIINKLKNFLESINYTGFAEFDLKYDLRDKEFKVLEINPRQARSSYYLQGCGYNLIEYLFDDIFEDKHHEFTFIDKEILLTMVPLSVIKKHINNKEYRHKAISLYRKKQWVDPLNYREDQKIGRKVYLLLRKYNYIKKYNKFTW